MAVICNICGLPEDLCACGELAKDSTKIIIRLETRRFKKKGTMIEGLDSKLNNLESVAKQLKNKYACGGTAKEGYVFLQGDHRDTIKETLVGLGISPKEVLNFIRPKLQNPNKILQGYWNSSLCVIISNIWNDDSFISSWGLCNVS